MCLCQSYLEIEAPGKQNKTKTRMAAKQKLKLVNEYTRHHQPNRLILGALCVCHLIHQEL